MFGKGVWESCDWGTFCMRSKKTRKCKQKKVGKEKKCPKREEKETLRQRSGVSRKATRVEKCRHVPLWRTRVNGLLAKKHHISLQTGTSRNRLRKHSKRGTKREEQNFCQRYNFKEDWRWLESETDTKREEKERTKFVPLWRRGGGRNCGKLLENWTPLGSAFGSEKNLTDKKMRKFFFEWLSMFHYEEASLVVACTILRLSLPRSTIYRRCKSKQC